MYWNRQTIGTCSLCGGAVQFPTAWWSVLPPTPTCTCCGATQRQAHGPVIDMVKPAPEPLKRQEYRKQWAALRVAR